jgi:Arc/MetJ-type ribon-helix-helix transcriptional regulator
MAIEPESEDQQKAEAMVSSGRFASVEEVLHADLQNLEREERYRNLVKAKIAKGLEDVAARCTLSRQEFLAEIKEQRCKRT